jgi:hypothetical protein
MDANEKLFAAIAAGNIQALRDALLEGANADALSLNGDRPIHLVADLGDVGMLEALIASRADIAALDGQGWSAEQRAIRAGNPEFAELFVAALASQHELPEQGQESQVKSDVWTKYEDVAEAIAKAASLDELKQVSEKFDASVWRDANPLVLSEEELLRINQVFKDKYVGITEPEREEDSIRPATAGQAVQESPAKEEGGQPQQHEAAADAIKPAKTSLLEQAAAAARRPKKLLGGKFVGDENGNYRRLGDEKVCLVDEIQRIRFIDKQMDTFEAAVELAKAKGWNAIEVTGSDRFRAEAWYVARKAGLEVVGYEATSKDLGRLGEGVSSAGPSEIEQSRKSAESAALQKVGAVQGVDAQGGRYVGPVVYQNEHHAVQDIGRGMSVIHELGKFPPIALRDFAKKDPLKIQYQGGSGRVEASQQDLGHGR